MKLNGTWKVVLNTAIAVIAASSFAWSVIDANEKSLNLRIEKSKEDLKVELRELKFDFKEFSKEQRDFNQFLIRALNKR